MGLLLSEIAEMVNGQIDGDANVEITGISGIREAEQGDVSFVVNKKYAHLIDGTKASALIVSNDVGDYPIPMIRVEDPDLAFAKVVESFLPAPLTFYKGIHPTAVIGEDVVIGEGVSIQAFSVIQDGCHISDGSIIYPGVYVGHHSKIGKNCTIYPRVVIRERTLIGDSVIIHSGAVIASDGFGFYTIEGVHHKIPQIGIVEIQDDVEIGANVTIERARFDRTLIGKGTKISNLVEIAHNVHIGENTVIIAQTALAGSCN
ncbi:MAG: UDP-3-O-(3-hydroxymyristoyl)glucosamine N-acyltransferase, partial [Armatimonadetes bacterium]|nr:UDP-3-O-(3-hydroxymyristoyl)glucosamine N-acyltransferase [Armatimonadota bacterium]